MPNDGVLHCSGHNETQSYLSLIQLDKFRRSLKCFARCPDMLRSNWVDYLISAVLKVRSTWYGEFETDRHFPGPALFSVMVSRQRADMLLTQAAVDLANFVDTQVSKHFWLPECVAAQNYVVCFLIKRRVPEKTWINSNQLKSDGQKAELSVDCLRELRTLISIKS